MINNNFPQQNYKNNLFVTGVGSRTISNNIKETIHDLVYLLHTHYDIVWRSGAANGSDIAFEHNALYKEIFLPWKGFNQSESELYLENFSKQKLSNARSILSEIRNTKTMKPTVLNFHTRNVFQVFGQDLDTLSNCVICYTDDGTEHHKDVTFNTGGTGTAIQLGSLYGIPVFNLRNSNCIDRLANHFNL